MKIIDIYNWERKEHYDYYMKTDYPQFTICKNIDITNFKKQLKNKGISFYYGMIYAATYTVNQIDDFKYRIKEKDVVLFERIHPTFTDMSEGTKLFKMVVADYIDEIEEFAIKSKEKSK